MPPQRPDLVLSSHVPDVEFDILVGDGLDVEADGRNGSDVLVELELVKDRCCAIVLAAYSHASRVGWWPGIPTCLASGVETQHQ